MYIPFKVLIVLLNSNLLFVLHIYSKKYLHIYFYNKFNFLRVKNININIYR